jgi:hypothetical protein
VLFLKLSQAQALSSQKLIIDKYIAKIISEKVDALTQVISTIAEKSVMAIGNFLIMNLLRLITPEEVGEIATKHNGGKFLSLTELVNERVERNIYRDFSSPDSMEEIHEAHASHQAKILPFTKALKLNTGNELKEIPKNSENSPTSTVEVQGLTELTEKEIEHKENENMSSFILIEKARLKRSQQILKQKEVFDLYQKNSSIDVEQIKNSNANLAQTSEAGVLINKKQY